MNCAIPAKISTGGIVAKNALAGTSPATGNATMNVPTAKPNRAIAPGSAIEISRRSTCASISSSGMVAESTGPALVQTRRSG
jgi:hypothetical protein